MIISTVRSRVDLLKTFDMKYDLGFVSSPKRFNVAISRAQSLLIVIGNPHVLDIDENWREMLRYCINA